MDPESHFLQMAALPLQHYFGGSFKQRGVLKTLQPVDLPILLLCFVPTLLALLLGAGIGQV